MTRTQRISPRIRRYLMISPVCPACGATGYRYLGDGHCWCDCGWRWQGITSTRSAYERRTASLTREQIGTACLREEMPADAIGILVTRYWPRGHRREEFPIWWRDLAPPRRLLLRYKQGQLSWEATAVRYRRWLSLYHDRSAWQQRVRDLVVLSRKRVVFLCFEVAENEAEVACHRRLLINWLLEGD